MNAFTSDNPQFSTAICRGQQSVAGRELQSIAQAAPSVTEYVAAALSQHTRQAYRCDVAAFLSWPGGTVPCTPEVLAAYIADCAKHLSPVSICRRVVAIGRAHTAQSLSNPAKSDLVRAVLRGVKRTHGIPQRQAAPLLRDDLIRILPRQDDIISVRDRALLLLGFASAMRRSELVSLDVSDLHFFAQGLAVMLRRSKTDQDGTGRKIAVPHGKTNACPVTAVRQWLEVACISGGAVFRSIQKGGRVSSSRLTAQSVSLILRRRAADAGLSTERLSAHSLRAGLVTSAAQAGIPAFRIMDQTGHKSVEMLSRYIRCANMFDGNAASIL